ncbi:type IV pilus twitching motility protein PilT [Shinella sumterensis]|jgi:defect-in-organelle-trafficking protein DotB|uniref:ATPase, T2SS/T4P/T4SS family n=1 Tax=Shinella sumterensis TaxID=1967501 RepID=A0AA50CVP8_9HYPH|nr:ATPase, T2SS/T4P/T4SS family [Shinella sumterensis]WLS01383.1 ATPase, T2SS/T4P/T4SS family [Shinella sumterensis]
MIDSGLLSEDPFEPRGALVPVLKEEPSRFDAGLDKFDAFLVGASRRGAADITIQSEARPRLKINNRQYFGTKRLLLRSEVDMLLGHLWRSTDAAGIINQGRALDFSYDVQVERGKRQRYRVNAVGIMKDGAPGLEITLRTLPFRTPTLDDVQFEEELRGYLHPSSGMIVIAGGTGHGKSTTMAAITRFHLEDRDNARKVCDFQQPIEFTYSDILTEHSDSASIIGQSEIGVGRNLPTFSDAVWAALRRGPSIINVGEARDVGSMKGCMQACVTGHIVNTTTHAGSIIEGLRRMVLEFPSEEQEARAFDLISSLQLFVVQRLLRKADGSGLIAVREYLLFDDDIRDRFYDTEINGWPALVSNLMKEARTNPSIVARSTGETARGLVEQGILSMAEARRFIPRKMLQQ